MTSKVNASMEPSSPVIQSLLSRVVAPEAVEDRNGILINLHRLCRFFNSDSRARETINYLLRHILDTPAFRVLCIRQEDGREKRYRLLPGQQILLGRSRRCDVTLSHSEISSVQCRIVHAQDGTIFVTDLGSRNGTYVNETLIVPFERMDLATGDTLRIRSYEIDIEEPCSGLDSSTPVTCSVSLQNDSNQCSQSRVTILQIRIGDSNEPLVIRCRTRQLCAIGRMYFGIGNIPVNTRAIQYELQRIIVDNFIESLCAVVLKKWGFKLEIKMLSEQDCPENLNGIRVKTEIPIGNRQFYLEPDVVYPVSSSFLAMLSSRIPLSQDHSEMNRFMDVRLPMMIGLRNLKWQTADINCLTPGDVLMCECPGTRENGTVLPEYTELRTMRDNQNPLVIATRPKIAGGMLDLEILNNPLWEDDTMSQSLKDRQKIKSQSANAQCKTRIVDLAGTQTTDVRIELGDITLSVRALAELVPGMIVPTQIEPNGLVNLYNCNQKLGRGRLILLDGEIGIEIVEIMEG